MRGEEYKMETVITKSKPNKKVKQQINRGYHSLTPWLFLLPAMIPLILFWFYPMLNSLYISFTNWDYISPAYTFVWFENYTNLIQDPIFHDVLWNTLYFTVGTVFPTIIGGVLLALLVLKNQRGMGIFRTVLFSPWVTPTVAVAIVWSWIFEPETGIANWVLSLVGLSGLEWTSSSTWAMPAIIIVSVWKGLGWTMIFYLNALRKIPTDIYEAASIDGAGSLQKFFKITVPLVSPTTFFLTIISTVQALEAYDQIQVMTQGGPAGSTRTLLYLYYQSAFEEFNMGKATAVATVIILITSILSIIQFGLSKKWVHYQ